MRPTLLACLLAGSAIACQPQDSEPSSTAPRYEVVQCQALQPTPPTQSEIDAFCSGEHGAPLPEELRHPPSLDDLDAKNAYDEKLQEWLREWSYRNEPYAWASDEEWRFTGPYAGNLATDQGQGRNYGVHPGVRIWYSPEVVEWLCGGRSESLPDGALIIKEMASYSALGPYFEGAPGEYMKLRDVNAQGEELMPSSWTVYVKQKTATFDGAYWANYTVTTAQGDGNPPITDRSAFVSTDEPGEDPPTAPNPDWYPTGYISPTSAKVPDVVYPYNQYGNYCINCHASAESELTFASLENVLTEGLRYLNLADNQICSQDVESVPTGDYPEPPGIHAREGTGSGSAADPLEPARAEPLPGWVEYYGALAGTDFADTWPHRMPAETYDHRTSQPDGPPTFLTSDQCIGCHDATYANSRVPNMMFQEEEADGSTVLVNLSPYGEWRASPMGLAGRDPIFFSQLESETNHLPPELTPCVENTCLHCHGVMGQRQLGIDTHDTYKGDDCEDLFGVLPPPGVQFGKPFRRAIANRYPGDGKGNDEELPYAALARDGISCTVCHHVSTTDLTTDAAFTGNWTPGPDDTLYGPFGDVIPKPMEHALGITPEHGVQTTESALCGACHNILLPVFSSSGQVVDDPVIKLPDGQPKQLFSYEQTTHLEWLNSDTGLGDPESNPEFRSCQDCHMPHSYDGVDLVPKIANIEDSTYPETTHALPPEDLTLKPREGFRRHALHGLNVFLNAFFEQFPLLLGARQIDYMTGQSVRAPLVTGRESMLEMARQETATLNVTTQRTGDGVEATVEVTSQVGHYLPSGTGFRRVFLEVLANDANGDLVWASGRTNDLGVILNGRTETPLPSEEPWTQSGSAQWQPHYEVIDSEDQVQIYQEVVLGTDGRLNTSFLRRAETVKDNRVRPRGFDPARYADPAFLAPWVNPDSDDALYIKRLAEEGPHGDDPGYCNEPDHDPDYCDPARTGRDSLTYQIQLDGDVQWPVTVKVSLYNQSIPPTYLHERFRDANVGVGAKTDIQRLYYLSSHLNTDVTDVGGRKYLEGYKLELASRSSQVE